MKHKKVMQNKALEQTGAKYADRKAMIESVQIAPNPFGKPKI